MHARFFYSCIFRYRTTHSKMVEKSSRHIERCSVCSRGSPLMPGLCEKCDGQETPFKTESCKRCKSHTTQLFLETKTVRKFCLKCRDFTENSEQTEIFCCLDCHTSMNLSSDRVYFICPRCSWKTKKNLFY